MESRARRGSCADGSDRRVKGDDLKLGENVTSASWSLRSGTPSGCVPSRVGKAGSAASAGACCRCAGSAWLLFPSSFLSLVAMAV